MENLIIGYDLGDMYSRISWYNEKKESRKSVAVLDNGKLFKLPTVLCLKPDGTWLAGAQAEEAIRHMLVQKSEILYKTMRLSRKLKWQDSIMRRNS